MKNFKNFLIHQELDQIKNLLIKVLTIPNKPTFKESKKAHDITEEYWTNPNSPLFPFLTKHNIKIPKTLPQFSQGGVGRVYFVDNYAVKFSANRVEANVAKMVQGNEQTPTTVIDVEYLGNGIYVILQPFVDMKNIPKQITQAADYVTVMIDEHPELKHLPTNPQEQEKLCKETLIKHNGDITLLPYMITVTDTLNKLYQSTGFYHNDAGPTNIGLYKNKLVIPDLGPNEPKDFNPLGTLSQIKKNRDTLGLPKHVSI